MSTNIYMHEVVIYVYLFVLMSDHTCLDKAEAEFKEFEV